MKLMTPRHFVVALALLCSVTLWGQNQNNKIDTTGNIGIGVTNPSNKLEVNGKTRLDSTLEVRDSAIFKKRVHIEEDVIIHGKTFMRDNGVANENFRVQNGFRVDGISHFYNNVFVDSTFRVETLGLFNGNLRVNGQLRTYGINNLFGTSRFHDEARLLHLNDTSGQNQDGLMMLSGNGLVKRMDIVEKDSLTDNDYVLGIDENGNISKVGLDNLPIGYPSEDITTGCHDLTAPPVWHHEGGLTPVLWTGYPCPAMIGIGTNEPKKTVDIIGTTRTSLLLVDNTNTTSPLVVQQDGNKILQLETNGTLLTRRIRVNMHTWPDYVFGEQYDLLSVEELEAFIQQNNHLPNVPSEATVKEEGVDLGEMDKVLLEKVEELTLYMIEQQKEIKKLKEEIKVLKEGGQ